MSNLYKLVLITGILALSGCGKEQSGQDTSASSSSPAPSASMNAPATTASKDSGMEKMEKMEKPAWARLEQNVYHYPQ